MSIGCVDELSVTGQPVADLGKGGVYGCEGALNKPRLFSRRKFDGIVVRYRAHVSRFRAKHPALKSVPDGYRPTLSAPSADVAGRHDVLAACVTRLPCIAEQLLANRRIDLEFPQDA